MSQPPALPDPQEPTIRIGNPERDAVVERLTAALNEGRLELVEYDDRVRQVYAARTFAELAPITADLPAPAPPPPPKPTLRSRLRLTQAERGWAGFAVFMIGIWAVSSIATGRLHHFWPIYVIGFTGIGLIARRVSGHRD